MAENDKTTDTENTEQKAGDAQKQPDPKKTAPRKKATSTVTIRGRISTTALRAGDEATVERTDTIESLIASGFVTEVKDKK